MALFRDCVIHTAEEIERIRVAMHMTAQVREQLVSLIRPGMSTLQIDQLAGDLIRSAGGTSGFLNYHGFPGNICISLNDEVVHGIGAAHRVVQESDIVSLDIGVKYNGAVGDTAVTVGFGELPKDTARLLKATQEALMAGIAAARKGNYIRDISRAVEKRALADRLGIVREMVGHGVGIQLHEPPDVPNYVTPVRGPKLVPGINNLHPLRHVMVRIYDKEPIGTTHLGTVYTDNDGNFSYTFTNPDGFWDFENGGYDIFIRVYAGDTNAMVEISDSGDEYYYESTVSENVSSGSTVTRNFTFTMSNDLGRAFQISQAIITARDYAWIMMGEMPSDVTIRYPYNKVLHSSSGL